TMNILQKLIDTAIEFPEKTAITDYRNPFPGSVRYVDKTYGQLINDVLATANNLQDKGLGKGDRVLIFVPMSYSLYITVLSLLYIGTSAVFMDAWANPERVRKACKVVNPKGFIGSGKAQSLQVHQEIRKIPIKLTLAKALIRSSQSQNLDIANIQPEKVATDDTAIITLTTGTTGLPKGANRTHGLLWEQFRIQNRHLQLSNTDIDLTALPVFVLNNLGLGVRSVLPRFNPAKPVSFKPENIVDQILENQVSTTIGSPAFFDKIAKHLIQNKINLPLQKIFTGGAPIFPPLASKLRLAFPGTQIEVLYGCTEAEPISHTAVDNLVDLAAFSGIPLGKGIEEIKVRTLDTAKASSPSNPGQKLSEEQKEVGEILISGPHVLKEYIGDPSTYADTKIEEQGEIWHRTGDAGRIEPDGTIYFYGKAKNCLNLNGEHIYPLPYEKELISAEAIAFACLLQIKDTIFAVLEPDKNAAASRKEIISRASRILDRISPDRIVLLNKIPRDPRHRSKVDYAQLQKILSKKYLNSPKNAKSTFQS
ncbi:MAG: AMP-binding protein, partial [Thermodesulfobacteriota bacterium]